MLTDNLQNDLKNAQLARDEVKVSTLRLLLSEIKNKEISKGDVLSDDEILTVVAREVKKRKEAAKGFRAGGREEGALKEEKELVVLQAYLPAQMSQEDLSKIVEETINETGAASLADMGKVIGAVMEKVKGQADGGTAGAMVKEKLAK
ncbi:GatB/YqeY domain-containing protein [Candidatus Daviesbacteria bacterium]|nr:GatB/YqeY domain-containing protein [Candidatus Daviesbacteria bacterium]